jgi:hypothetical protein
MNVSTTRKCFFVLGNARVGHATHPLFEDLRIVVLREVAVLGEVFLALVRDEPEQRLF